MRVTLASLAIGLLLLLGALDSPRAAEPSSTEILAAVTLSLASQLGITSDKIDPDTKFSNLKPRPDQLDVVELIMTLEESFQIEITDAAIARVVGSSELEAITSDLTARSLSEVIASTLR